MRLQDKQHKHPPFDVASGLGSYLLTTAVFEPYTDQPVKKPRDTDWIVNRAGIIPPIPPSIDGTCGTCGGHTHYEGPEPRKNPLQHFAVCGGAGFEEVPDYVVKEYMKLRAKFYPTPKPKSALDELREQRRNNAS